jgi:excisionase family DNA binding protein
MAEQKKWITVAQAAKESGYSVRTIQQLLKEGKIEGIKPSRDWFTTLESIIVYKESAKIGRPKKDQESP